MNWLNDWPKKYFGHIPFKSITKQKTYFSHILWLPYWSFIIGRWWDSKEALFSASAEFYGASKFSSYKLALFRKLCGRLHNVHNLCSKVWKKKAKKPFFTGGWFPFFCLTILLFQVMRGIFFEPQKNYYYNCYLCMLLTQLFFFVSRANCKSVKSL